MGSVMKGTSRIVIVVIAVAFVAALSSYVMSKDSTSGDFSVSSEFAFFNWTNDTINITSNINGTNFTIYNTSTSIDPIYFTAEQYNADLTSDERTACFTQKGFLVENQSGYYIRFSEKLNASEYTLFFLRPHMFCPPGKYKGNFSVYNGTNTSERVYINTTIVIPINTDNTINQTTQAGYFRGSITSAHASSKTYHSYYLNKSAMSNATSVTMKLVPATSNIDLFLFGSSGNRISQSLNMSTKSDEITVSTAGVSDMWEIRVYGNASSVYNAYLYYNTLNFTHLSGNYSISSLDLGVLDPNGTASDNYKIKNEHNWNVSSVRESVEIYHKETVSGQNTTSSYRFLVPSFARKVKAVVQWLPQNGNVSDWNINLTDVNGNLVGTSTSKYINSNATGGIREEYIEYNGPFTLSKKGYWNVSVKNATSMPVQGIYNLTFYIWVNGSSWIDTNFTNLKTFREAGNANSSAAVGLSLDLPTDNILNGTYEGSVTYYNTAGWKAVLPLSFEVRTGNLMINSMFGNASTRNIKRNIGFNESFSFKIPYNNTGYHNVYYNYTNSSGKLYWVSNSSFWMNFSVSGISSPVINDSNGEMTVTVNVNTKKTGNGKGIYRGWMFFNTTNATLNSSSHPYRTFNMTLEVNLTSWLNVTVIKILPSKTNVTRNTTNISVIFKVALQNGTVISNIGSTSVWNASSFSSFQLKERNRSSYTSTLTRKTSNATSGNWCGFGQKCAVNGTVPQKTVGGYYNATFTASWRTKDKSLLTGSAKMLPKINLSVRDKGIHMWSDDDTTPHIDEGGEIVYFQVYVLNHGPLTATGKLNMSGSCAYATIEAYDKKDNCGNKGTRYFTMDILGNATEQCWYKWKITSVDDITASSSECTLSVVSFDNTFANITGIYLTVENVSSGGNDDSGNGYTPDDEGGNFTFSISITKYPKVLKARPGESLTANVTAKNTGDVSSAYKLAASVGGGINTTITPSVQSIGISVSKNFTVAFSVANSSSLGNHSGTFKAYVSLKTDVYDMESFTFTVLSTTEREREINGSYFNYSDVFDAYLQNFTQIKASGVIPETNLTLAEFIINQTRDLLESIKEAILSGDFATAESLLTDVNFSLSEVKSKISELGVEKVVAQERAAGTTWVWVVVIVVVAGIAGLFVYMLLPPKGYKVRTTIGSPKPLPLKQRIAGIFGAGKKPGLRQRIACLFKRKPKDKKEKDACKKYANGYEKQKSEGYKFRK